MKLRCGILLCCLICLLLLSSTLAYRTRRKNVPSWLNGPTSESNKKNFTFPHSGEWIRLRRAQTYLTSGVVQVYRSGKWGYVCDDNWDIEDASVACRQLGFTRGAIAAGGFSEFNPSQEWENAEILMDEVHCTGTEKALHLCNYDTEHDCGPTEAATVLCMPNEGCPLGWVAGFGKCYKFATSAVDIRSAQKYCVDQNASLVTIESASENHFISNILKNMKSSLRESHQWYTGGMKVKQDWKWSKSVQLLTTKTLNSKPKYRIVRSTIEDPVSWFPGWPSASPSLSEPKPDPNFKCLTLTDEFESPTNSREIVDYYFWKADVCKKANGIDFVCQMENKIIPMEDCYNSRGTDYRGFATITEKGSHCLNWLDSWKINNRTHPDKGLGDHNYCRNPDSDARPWCWTDHEKLHFSFCKIAKCSDVADFTESHSSPDIPEEINCQSEKFYCSQDSECIPKAFRCDKDVDCLSGEDEENCDKNVDKVEVTLVGGDENSGTVEITYMGEKGLICDDDWTIEDAHVVCRMLGYGKAEKATTLDYFDHPNEKVVFMLDDVNCSGNESSIKDCPKSNWKQHDCSVFEIAGAVCKSSKVCTSEQFTCKTGDCLQADFVCDKIDQCGDNSDETNCEDVEFKLVNGNTPNEGRVEVIRNGLQGTVCDDGWDEKEVAVICRTVGFWYGGKIVSNGKFGRGTGPIWLDNLHCNGPEFSLSDCQHDKWGVGDCDHSEDVAVVCNTRQQAIVRPTAIASTLSTRRPTYRPTRPSEGPSISTTPNYSSLFSLEGGSGPHEGVVVITIRGRKYYICDDNWDDVDASVMCRTLNISEDGVATTNSQFGDFSSTNYLFDEVQCTGIETSLATCLANIGLNKHDCTPTEQAGVICKINTVQTNDPSNIITTMNPTEKGKCGYRPFDHKDLLNIRERRSIVVSDLHARRHNTQKIIGGNYARHGEYPWQVRVSTFLSSETSNHHCGAVIISEYWLLSAAHCFVDHRKSTFQIIVGDHHKNSKDSGEQTFNVEHIITHEQYINPDYDIALIKIKPVNGSGIVYNDFVQPACLPDVNTDYSTNLECSISGWGRSAQGPVYPDVLKGIKIPIIEQSVCSSLLNDSSFTDRMICAGFVEGGIDTCDGDSGGPLVCKEKGSYTVLGITSWGNGCALPKSPGAYAKVKYFLSWISTTINSFSSNGVEKTIPSRT